MTSDINALSSWYAIRTKPMQEHRAEINLTRWGIETFFPRVSPPLRPLFPGYIFAKFCVDRMLRSIGFTRGIAYVVSFGGVPAAIPDEVVTAIRSRIGDDGLVMMGAEEKGGKRVVVRSGLWQGFVGIFEKEMPDRARVRILLDMIEYRARLELPKSAIGWC